MQLCSSTGKTDPTRSMSSTRDLQSRFAIAKREIESRRTLRAFVRRYVALGLRKKRTRRGLERCLNRAAGDHFVNESVLDCLRRGHEVVAVGVFLDLLDVLAGMMRENLVQHLAQAQRFTRVNLDIARLPFEAARDLMNQYPRMRQRVAAALGARA